MLSMTHISIMVRKTGKPCHEFAPDINNRMYRRNKRAKAELVKSGRVRKENGRYTASIPHPISANPNKSKYRIEKKGKRP